jgi:glycosyltransferase involved in cell wall biosynthesis
MVILSHPTGNNNVREAAVALAESAQLEKFHTCIAACDNNIFQKLGCLPGLSEIKRRSCPDTLFRYLQLHPWRELCRLVADRLGLDFLTKHEAGFLSIDSIYRSLDKSVSNRLSKGSVRAVYCYEDGALETFRIAKKYGLTCIYEHPVGYWRKVHELSREEVENQPAWVEALPSLKDSRAKLERKDEELRLADYIIVPSSYSRLSLQICPFDLAPIIVVPYGVPKVCDLPGGGSFEKKGVLKVLFVGGLTQLKGLSYLFDAVKILGSIVRLTLIGRMPSLNCAILNKSLECHRWIPSLPHEQILEEMRNHDVLVLPSLSDGFGMVVTEALSQGVPVIITPHSCGPDVITNDVDGFIVPIRSAESIAEKLEILYNNRAKLAEMHVAALKKAKERNWSSYRLSISRTVSSIIQSPDLRDISQKLPHDA